MQKASSPARIKPLAISGSTNLRPSRAEGGPLASILRFQAAMMRDLISDTSSGEYLLASFSLLM